MKLVGLNYTTNAEGRKNTTLQVTDEYNSYYSNAEAGRGCMGVKVEAIYVGDIDCSALKIGQEIERQQGVQGTNGENKSYCIYGKKFWI